MIILFYNKNINKIKLWNKHIKPFFFFWRRRRHIKLLIVYKIFKTYLKYWKIKSCGWKRKEVLLFSWKDCFRLLLISFLPAGTVNSHLSLSLLPGFVRRMANQLYGYVPAYTSATPSASATATVYASATSHALSFTDRYLSSSDSLKSLTTSDLYSTQATSLLAPGFDLSSSLATEPLLPPGIKRSTEGPGYFHLQLFDLMSFLLYSQWGVPHFCSWYAFFKCLGVERVADLM